MTNEFLLHQCINWWKKYAHPATLLVKRSAVSFKGYLKTHAELLKGVRFGIKIANDLDTFRRLRVAIKEGNAKRAAWYAFLLGMTLAEYLRALLDLLDGGEDDDWEEGEETPPPGPADGLSKKEAMYRMQVFLRAHTSQREKVGSSSRSASFFTMGAARKQGRER